MKHLSVELIELILECHHTNTKNYFCLRGVSSLFHHILTKPLQDSPLCHDAVDHLSTLNRPKSILQLERYHFTQYTYDNIYVFCILRNDIEMTHAIEDAFHLLDEFLSYYEFTHYRMIVSSCRLPMLQYIHDNFIIPKAAIVSGNWSALIKCIACEQYEVVQFLVEKHHLHQCDFEQILPVVKKWKPNHLGVPEWIKDQLIFHREYVVSSVD